MKRIDRIVEHLVGTKLPLESALSEAELDNPDLLADLSERIRQNRYTDKWERYEPAKL